MTVHKKSEPRVLTQDEVAISLSRLEQHYLPANQLSIEATLIEDSHEQLREQLREANDLLKRAAEYPDDGECYLGLADIVAYFEKYGEGK